MAILGTPIIDIWCERKLNEDGTHSAILNWNPKYAKVFIYRKKDGNSWEQTPIIVTNSNTYEDIIDSQNKEYDYLYKRKNKLHREDLYLLFLLHLILSSS